MSALLGGKGAQRAAQAQMDQQRADNERLRKSAMDDRRELGEQDAGRRRARLFGGKRMLLSDARLDPERGVDTLGAGPRL